MSNDTFYTPGVCNLNTPEVAYRRKAGHIGLAISLVVFAVLAVLHVAPLWGLVMFAPLFVAAIGYLQAKNKFCVSYASSGVYNASAEYADTAKIVEEASRKLDKSRARKMNSQAAAIGLVGAIISIVILALI